MTDSSEPQALSQEEKFKRWAEPATKGDVIQAMVWTQALVGAVFGVVVAIHGKDTKEIAKAIDDYASEWAEYRDKAAEIGGAKL